MTQPHVVLVGAVLILISLVSSSYVRAQQVEAVPRNQTTTWEVRPFTPVTDAVLRNPDPKDWLMLNRTYDFQGYSPLDQITRDNVGQLQLAWMRAMDSGPQEIRPLVYDGVMYIAHPNSDHLQALDATTGDLIWDYTRQPPPDLREYAALGNRTRHLAIYGANIFHLSADDAHLIALDARTGELAWESQLADYRDGITHSSGAMIVEGKVLSGRTCSPSSLTTPVSSLRTIRKPAPSCGGCTRRPGRTTLEAGPGGTCRPHGARMCRRGGFPGATIRRSASSTGASQFHCPIPVSSVGVRGMSEIARRASSTRTRLSPGM